MLIAYGADTVREEAEVLQADNARPPILRASVRKFGQKRFIQEFVPRESILTVSQLERKDIYSTERIRDLLLFHFTPSKSAPRK